MEIPSQNKYIEYKYMIREKLVMNFWNKIEEIGVPILLGMFLGIMITLSTSYKLAIADVEQYKNMCGYSGDIVSVQVRLSGKIVSITCKNGLEVPIH